ncbi:unnamed protein product [Camellia sinensis]
MGRVYLIYFDQTPATRFHLCGACPAHMALRQEWPCDWSASVLSSTEEMVQRGRTQSNKSKPELLESIVIASFTIVTVLVILPCKYINGSPVPTVIFKGLPFTFQAFVVVEIDDDLLFFMGKLSSLDIGPEIVSHLNLQLYPRLLSLASFRSALHLSTMSWMDTSFQIVNVYALSPEQDQTVGACTLSDVYCNNCGNLLGVKFIEVANDDDGAVRVGYFLLYRISGSGMGRGLLLETTEGKGLS